MLLFLLSITLKLSNIEDLFIQTIITSLWVIIYTILIASVQFFSSGSDAIYSFFEEKREEVVGVWWNEIWDDYNVMTDKGQYRVGIEKNRVISCINVSETM